MTGSCSPLDGIALDSSFPGSNNLAKTANADAPVLHFSQARRDHADIFVFLLPVLWV
jgi:hypothetical protein